MIVAFWITFSSSCVIRNHGFIDRGCEFDGFIIEVASTDSDLSTRLSDEGKAQKGLVRGCTSEGLARDKNISALGKYAKATSALLVLCAHIA